MNLKKPLYEALPFTIGKTINPIAAIIIAIIIGIILSSPYS